jgi:subtilisin family serine protease
MAVAFSLMLTAPAFAAPKFTLQERSTWDADMINSPDAHSMGYTGAGVYIAVLDTGLAPNWRDYFPSERIATKLGKGFVENVHYNPQTGELVSDGFVHETSWIGEALSTHGTHVVSTIIGYNYYAPADAAAGLPLPPLFIEGIAPDAMIIPVKVLSDYTFAGVKTQFGTDNAIAAGIRYVTELKISGYSPMVISMSLGGDEPSDIIEGAINDAIEAGVIVVASAGNDGLEGMGWPGAYPQVISVGSCGWAYEWIDPTFTTAPWRLWWLQDSAYGYNDIPETGVEDLVYVSDFSSRENDGRVPGYDQDLDVLAPGSWVRGPYPGFPGYNHLPWWSSGKPHGWPVEMGNNFYFVGGTSMSAPHVSAVIAMMLQADPSLTQVDIETIIETTALPIPHDTGMWVIDISPEPDWYWREWGGAEATGAGLIQADAAVAAAIP